MSKLIIYCLKLFTRLSLLGLLFYLFFPNEALAVDWQKYPANPIFDLSIPTYGWDTLHVVNPHILKSSSSYRMWYDGHDGISWKIGYAYSPNGLSSWTRNTAPLISAELNGTWEKETTDAFIIASQSAGFQMWYTSLNSDHWSEGIDRFRTMYSTSIDGLIWTKIDWVLRGGTSGSWDSGGTGRGRSIIYKNGVYHLWYAGTNENNLGSNPFWRIGYAVSSDGINWTKEYQGNPIIIDGESSTTNVSYPTVLYSSGIFHMWYGTGLYDLPTQIAYAYSADGILWIKPLNQNLGLTRTSGSFDQNNITPSTIILDENILKMWYSGYDGAHWRIGYATASASILPTPDPATIPTAPPLPTSTPTSTPTPTPTPTTTPTPTPTPKKVVIVPGLGGSWNTGALLSCSLANSPDDGWIITPTFGTAVYQPLYNDLQLAGYEPQYFTYDWRKNIPDINQRLASFLNSLAPGSEKVSLVGHSMGGLVGKSYLQSTDETSNKLDKLLMVGSPHDGAVAAYPVWSAGEIWTGDLRIRIAMTFVIEACGKLHGKTNRDMVRALMPSFGNLLPRFGYLIDVKSNLSKTPVDAQNTWPLTPITNPYLGTTVGTISGYGLNTPASLIVKNPTMGDLKYPNWLDGKPIETITTTDGDNTVLNKSATLSGVPDISLPLDHAGLINSPDGRSAIAKFLGTSDVAFLGTSQNIQAQSALMIVAYPSSLWVTDPAWGVRKGIQSMVGFLNPKNGSYRLLVLPTSDTTRLIIAQFLPNNQTFWKEYTLTGKLPKIHTITFDDREPKEDILR